MLKNLSFNVKPVRDKSTNDDGGNPLENILLAKQYAHVATDVIDHVTACAVITVGTYFTFKTVCYVAIFGAKRLFR
jgi:hypothetical protein